MHVIRIYLAQLTNWPRVNIQIYANDNKRKCFRAKFGQGIQHTH